MADRSEPDITQANRFGVLTVGESGHANGRSKSSALTGPNANGILNADDNNDGDSDADECDEAGPPVHEMEFVVTSEWSNSQQSFQLQVDHNRPRGLHLQMKHSKRPKSKTKKLEIFRATINGKRLHEAMHADFAVAHENAYTGVLKLLFQRSSTVVVREGNKYKSTLIREDERNERAFRQLREHPERSALYESLCKLDIVVPDGYESLRPTFMDNRKNTNAKQTAHITYATISLEDGERFNPNNKLHQQQPKITFPYPPNEPVPPDRWQCGVQINGIELVSECGQTSMQAEAFATRAVMNLFANHAGYFRLGSKYIRELNKVTSIPFGYKEENFPSLGTSSAAVAGNPSALPKMFQYTSTSAEAAPSWIASRMLRPLVPFPAVPPSPSHAPAGLSEFQQRCVRSQVPALFHNNISSQSALGNRDAFGNHSSEHASDQFLGASTNGDARPFVQPVKDPATAEMEALRAAIARSSRNKNVAQQDFRSFPAGNNISATTTNDAGNSSQACNGTFVDGIFSIPSHTNSISSGFGAQYSFGAIGDEVRAAEQLASRRNIPILNSMYSSSADNNAAFNDFNYPALSTTPTSSNTFSSTPVADLPVTENYSPWPIAADIDNTKKVQCVAGVDDSAPLVATTASTTTNPDFIISEITLSRTALVPLCGIGNSSINSCTRALNLKYELLPVCASDEYSTLRLIGLADNIRRVKRILSSRLIQHCGQTLQQAIDDAEMKLSGDKTRQNSTHSTSSLSSSAAAVISRVRSHDADIVRSNFSSNDDENHTTSAASDRHLQSSSVAFFDNNAGVDKFTLYEQRLEALENENKALKTAITILTKDRDEESKEMNAKYENLLRQHQALEDEKNKCCDELGATKYEFQLMQQEMQTCLEKAQKERDDWEQREQKLYEELGNVFESQEKLELKIAQEKQDAHAPLECVICRERLRNTVFEPCRHAVVCSTCWTGMKGSKKCPICQQSVEKMGMLYLS